VKNTLAVILFGIEQVKDNASEFVGGGSNRLRPESVCDPAEEFPHVVFGVNFLSYFEGHYMVVMPPVLWRGMLGQVDLALRIRIP
jgi:hypothetical protein